ncbi:saccharopine dehydrogenase [Glycomyces sp. L485]|uniref:saccharopine dehydrogenase n=1 Tax=Glycomyces sp. L485 TaxID=2909235 RepID=UPI001F4A41FF|nr:saccharopine dehydrogenase [Glycomyces sp. L485]MCH7230952.1 saccharopine dehydrogenase [Glycomyces sp. L485]
MTGPHLWLRAETHPSERRTPLTPAGAAALIEQGATVTVEDSPARCHPTEDYLRVGARAAAAGSWPDAPADAFVLGLKALPEGDGPITGRHLYFAHAYKGQEGADALLARFAAGRGEILDLEYLADGQGRRLAAFGHWAGYAGAALAIRQWNGDFDGPLAPASKTEFDAALRPPVRRPRVLVVGALGRCGRGALSALERVGITPVPWDLAETARLDREAILAHDILINAVGVTEPAEILLGPEHLRTGRRLSLIVDVTCDVGSPYHLLPVYDRLTTWDVPVRASADGLAVIAIDNLPSLLPREASDDFSAQLAPHLSLLPDGDAWKRSRRAFRTALRDEELDHV